MGLEGRGQVVEDVAALAAEVDGRQHPFDEAASASLAVPPLIRRQITAWRTASSETLLVGSTPGRREVPQAGFQPQQVRARRGRATAAAPRAVAQGLVDESFQAAHRLLICRFDQQAVAPCDGAGTAGSTAPASGRRTSRRPAAIDHRLEVAAEMAPAQLPVGRGDPVVRVNRSLPTVRPRLSPSRPCATSASGSRRSRRPCRRCKGPLDGVDAAPLVHQVAEVPPIEPWVDQYLLHRLKCPGCGATTCGGLPEGSRRAASARLQAVLAALAGRTGSANGRSGRRSATSWGCRSPPA